MTEHLENHLSMKDKGTTMLFLAGLLLTVVAPSFGQVAPRKASAFMQPTPRPFRVEEAAPDARTIAADTTLRFYDLSKGALDQGLGAADFFFVRAVGLFFTAPFDGTIDRIDFELSNFCQPSVFCSPGVAGTGTLRIKLIEGTEVPLNPPFQPGVDSLDVEFSADSLDVNFSNLMAYGNITPNNFINQIDVSDRNFEIRDSVQYFIQLALIDESADAALTFIFDGGSNDSTDTRYFIDGAFARTILYVDFVDPEGEDRFLPLPGNDTTFVHPNVLFELQLSKDEPPPGSARLQVVHNAPGTDAVDLYVGDSLVVDDLGFRQATSFLAVTAGLQTIDLVAASDLTNSNPLVSITDSLAENQFYWTMAFGTLGQNLDVAIAPVPSDTSGGDPTALIVAHGGLGAESVTVRILDETLEHNAVDTLTQDLGFGQFAAPVALAPGLFNIEVATTGIDPRRWRHCKRL